METLETVLHESRTLRVRVVTDDSPYDTGDLFTRAGVKYSPLDTLTDHQLKERERKFLKELRDSGGPWGYVVERRCPTSDNRGRWEHVASCRGFGDIGFAKGGGVEAMDWAFGQHADS